MNTLVLDFDGTLATADVGDALCDRFAPPHWRRIDERWTRRELSLPEAQRQMWALARATRAEMEAHALLVGGLRPGLSELFAAAKARGYRVVVASGGFDFYIRPLLGARMAELDDLVTNSAHFDGDRIVLEFNDRQVDCPTCAVCKGRVCEQERDRHSGKVVFVGDGHSDRCILSCSALRRPGPAADRVAAVAGGALAAECERLGHAYEPFTDLATLVPML